MQDFGLTLMVLLSFIAIRLNFCASLGQVTQKLPTSSSSGDFYQGDSSSSPSSPSTSTSSSSSSSPSSPALTPSSQRKRPSSKRPKLNVKTFWTELSSIGLTKDSTLSDVEINAKDLMDRYNGNSKATEQLTKYLYSIKVDNRVILLYRAKKNREPQTINKRIERARNKSERGKERGEDQRQKLKNTSRDPLRREKYLKYAEEKAEQLDAQLQQFKDEIFGAKLSYSMEPEDYVKKEVKLRERLGSSFYAFYQLRLQKNLNVDPVWREGYRKARRKYVNSYSHSKQYRVGKVKVSKSVKAKDKGKRIAMSEHKHTSDNSDTLSLSDSSGEAGETVEEVDSRAMKAAQDALAFPQWHSRRKRTGRTPVSERGSPESAPSPNSFMLPRLDVHSSATSDDQNQTSEEQYSFSLSPVEAVRATRAAKRPRQEAKEVLRPTYAKKTFRGRPQPTFASIKPSRRS